MTSNGRQTQNIKSIISHWLDLPEIVYISWWNQNKFILLKIMIASNGRRPQHYKSGISQQPLIISFSNIALKPRESNQNWILLDI
jgi:hypothetical protein